MHFRKSIKIDCSGKKLLPPGLLFKKGYSYKSKYEHYVSIILRLSMRRPLSLYDVIECAERLKSKHYLHQRTVEKIIKTFTPIPYFGVTGNSSIVVRDAVINWVPSTEFDTSSLVYGRDYTPVTFFDGFPEIAPFALNGYGEIEYERYYCTMCWSLLTEKESLSAPYSRVLYIDNKRFYCCAKCKRRVNALRGRAKDVNDCKKLLTKLRKAVKESTNGNNHNKATA